MPDNERVEALQVVPGTLRERLGQLVGQQVVVYLMGVHARLAVMPAHPGWPASPQMAVPPWCPPSPRPGPCPPSPGPQPYPPSPGPAPCPGPERMGTAVVTGTLVFAGGDYLVVREGGNMGPPMGPNMGLRDVFIPYNAVAMIIPARMMT